VPAPAGSSIIEPGVSPAHDLTLDFATWTDFAEVCGLSRFWGGVHFLPSIDNMRELGRPPGQHRSYSPFLCITPERHRANRRSDGDLRSRTALLKKSANPSSARESRIKKIKMIIFIVDPQFQSVQ
jgi:hypothetical protein